jgi:hypothetical protein
MVPQELLRAWMDPRPTTRLVPHLDHLMFQKRYSPPAEYGKRNDRGRTKTCSSVSRLVVPNRFGARNASVVFASVAGDCNLHDCDTTRNRKRPASLQSVSGLIVRSWCLGMGAESMAT